jgi:hypothetical protein
MLRHAAVFLCCAALNAPASVAAQTALVSAIDAPALDAIAELPAGFDGPPVPVLPDTVSRDQAGHVVVRAIRLTTPFRLDGKLDEAVYREAQPASDFLQTEPVQGSPATEKTEIWVLFDDRNIYIGARMWETHPERMVVNEMRKDSPNAFQNESLTIVLDTFYDRRNGVGFLINPIGGRQDGQITNEKWNRDWNTIFDFGVGTFDGGWTAELAIPFKSLRYRPGASQLWGLNARRVNKWKNETSHLVDTGTAIATGAVYRMSRAATVVGLEVPSGAKNVDIKPYATSNLTTDRNARPSISNDVGADLGVDVKYGVTQNLTADFTYNTDFAQVEADEQQVNLTRFSLFFPEKRDFFLENPGLFAFGGVTVNNGQPSSEAPMLFYSRRIGLNQGRVVPLNAGARLTGRVGRYAVGLMNIQTGEETVSQSRSTNFSLLRVKRDVLRKSSIGLIATGRSINANGSGSNAVVGLDGAFSFFEDVFFDAYWAKTQTTGLSGDDASYRGAFSYTGDRYGLDLERLSVGTNFNPEVGFVRRYDMRRNLAVARFSPRPRNSKLVRKYVSQGTIDYVENGAGRLETRDSEAQFGIEFQNSDRLTATYVSSYELLPRPFRIAPGIVLPVKGYNSNKVRISHSLGTQRLMSGNAFVEYGTFYSGHRMTTGLSSGRLKVTSQFALEPTYSINKVDLLEGSFTTHLAGSRITYSMTPLMFASALVQYNSTNHLMAANARLRWEYAPGSELFVVYNEERDTLDPLGAPRFPELANRSFIIKINRLLRF